MMLGEMGICIGIPEQGACHMHQAQRKKRLDLDLFQISNFPTKTKVQFKKTRGQKLSKTKPGKQ